jgi:hypothetical protein
MEIVQCETIVTAPIGYLIKVATPGADIGN